MNRPKTYMMALEECLRIAQYHKAAAVENEIRILIEQQMRLLLVK